MNRTPPQVAVRAVTRLVPFLITMAAFLTAGTVLLAYSGTGDTDFFGVGTLAGVFLRATGLVAIITVAATLLVALTCSSRGYYIGLLIAAVVGAYLDRTLSLGSILLGESAAAAVTTRPFFLRVVFLFVFGLGIRSALHAWRAGGPNGETKGGAAPAA